MSRNTFIFTLLFVAILAGCGRKPLSGVGRQALLSNDSVPSEVKDLVRAVASEDSAGFARLIAYPLERPYPLKDIADEKQMRSYYNVLVDDSLRSVIAESGPDRWSSFGWRGWSVDDGSYIWVDSQVYAIPYLSQAERSLRTQLVGKEMSTLAPALRGGWTPVMAFMDDESGEIFRIDSEKDGETGVYRLAVYAPGADLHKDPAQVLSGRLVDSGTQLDLFYRFTAADHVSGKELVYEMAQSDPESGKPRIWRGDGDIEGSDLRKVYWLDLVK